MERFNLHKKTLIMWRFLISVLLLVLVFLVSLFLPIGQLWWWIVIVFLSIIFLTAFLVYLPWYNKLAVYWIGEDSVRIQRGVLFRSNSVVPYQSVQYAEVVSNPVEKIFGLASVRIICSGGKLFLFGFSQSKAQELLETIFPPVEQEGEENE